MLHRKTILVWELGHSDSRLRAVLVQVLAPEQREPGFDNCFLVGEAQDLDLILDS